MKTILLVCTGNTCRSPLAQVILQDLLAQSEEEDYQVVSAGLSAFPGQQATEKAIEVAAEKDFDLKQHQSQQLSSKMVAEADLILTMTASQARRLRLSYQEKAQLIYALGHFVQEKQTVRDPFGGSLATYRKTRDQLEELLSRAVVKLPQFFSQEGNSTRGQNYNNRSNRRDKVKIALGSDHAGYLFKEELKEWLEEQDYEIIDQGTDSEDSVDYPDFAGKVACSIAEGQAELGILICGTGIGMAISANKVAGIRAARCQDSYSARMARAHNNANVLTLGARVIGQGLAREVVTAFLTTEFAGDRHQRRVDKITGLEKELKE